MTNDKQNIPELDLSAPLPILVKPQVDEVMKAAKREWYLGLSLFVVFYLPQGG